MIEIKSILGGVSLAKEIAGYLGLYETLSVKIDKLLRTDLHAGIKALEQSAKTDIERKELLREARQAFNRATSLEKNERLMLGYLGLAMCHKNLEDERNFVSTLGEVKYIKFEGELAEVAKGTFKGNTLGTPFGLIPGIIFGAVEAKVDVDNRVINFNRLKLEIQSFLDNYHT